MATVKRSRAGASPSSERNVSAQSLYGSQFTLSTQLINPRVIDGDNYSYRVKTLFYHQPLDAKPASQVTQGRSLSLPSLTVTNRTIRLPILTFVCKKSCSLKNPKSQSHRLGCRMLIFPAKETGTLVIFLGSLCCWDTYRASSFTRVVEGSLMAVMKANLSPVLLYRCFFFSYQQALRMSVWYVWTVQETACWFHAIICVFVWRVRTL